MARPTLDTIMLAYLAGVLLSSWLLGHTGEPHLWYKKYLRENAPDSRGTAVELLLMFGSVLGIAIQVGTMLFTPPPLPPMPTHDDVHP